MTCDTGIRQRTARACLGLAALMGGVAAVADDTPSVTPYRPSVSTPAALSAPGWLEVEAGVLRSRSDDPARRESVPYTLKLAWTPDWGIRLGGDALVRQVGADGSALRGTGDTTVVLKRRFELNEASALGLELGAKFPTARAGLGSGHSDLGLNGIYSADFGDSWHTDINVLRTHLGGVAPGMGSWQDGWAASLSRNLSDRWGVVAEWSGTRQRSNPSTGLALLATSYSYSKSITLDIGTSKGLNAGSGGWSVFSGVTFMAGRIF